MLALSLRGLAARKLRTVAHGLRGRARRRADRRARTSSPTRSTARFDRDLPDRRTRAPTSRSRRAGVRSATEGRRHAADRPAPRSLQQVRADPDVAGRRGLGLRRRAVLGKDGERDRHAGGARSSSLGTADAALQRVRRSPRAARRSGRRGRDRRARTRTRQHFKLGDTVDGPGDGAAQGRTRLVGITQFAGVDSFGGARSRSADAARGAAAARQDRRVHDDPGRRRAGRRRRDALARVAARRAAADGRTSAPASSRPQAVARTSRTTSASCARSCSCSPASRCSSARSSSSTRSRSPSRSACASSRCCATLGATRRQVLRAVLGEGADDRLLGSVARPPARRRAAPGLQGAVHARSASTCPSNGIVIAAAHDHRLAASSGTLVTARLGARAGAARDARAADGGAARGRARCRRGRAARWRTIVAGTLLGARHRARSPLGLFGGGSTSATLHARGRRRGRRPSSASRSSARTSCRPLALGRRAAARALRGITGRLARENAVRQPGPHGRHRGRADGRRRARRRSCRSSPPARRRRSPTRSTTTSRPSSSSQNTDGFSPFSGRVMPAVGQVDGVVGRRPRSASRSPSSRALKKQGGQRHRHRSRDLRATSTRSTSSRAAGRDPRARGGHDAVAKQVVRRRPRSSRSATP